MIIIDNRRKRSSASIFILLSFLAGFFAGILFENSVGNSINIGSLKESFEKTFQCEPDYVLAIANWYVQRSMMGDWCKSLCYKNYGVQSYKLLYHDCSMNLCMATCYCDIHDCNPENPIISEFVNPR